jgi:hypothetical protein
MGDMPKLHSKPGNSWHHTDCLSKAPGSKTDIMFMDLWGSYGWSRVHFADTESPEEVWWSQAAWAGWSHHTEEACSRGPREPLLTTEGHKAMAAVQAEGIHLARCPEGTDSPRA